MYRVLLPIDIDEDRARSQVSLLESLPGSIEEIEVVLLHVYEQVDTPADEAGSAVIEEINESIVELQGRPESVDAVEEELDALGVDHTLIEHVGDPSDGILTVADEEDVDAIVLGLRKRSPVGKALFGSVSQTVILNADRPVFLGKP
ncbi:universal stress protein [Halorubrum vacuolatum]|uniref:Nucleotide-binding universal stress protein, UspA family n=1 Tax=Halorubrum vacuolatum TaxID=63740 RepID=A0A238UW99_HALVU|nr:universal stress protein [Halorubrum vacuolatum]SNR25613.1 Nucleotide-binding universal stress protein, UspA family [Halorubrum vacuolatum]